MSLTVLLAASQHWPCGLAAWAGDLLGAMFDCATAMDMPPASNAAAESTVSFLSFMMSLCSLECWQHCQPESKPRKGIVPERNFRRNFTHWHLFCSVSSRGKFAAWRPVPARASRSRFPRGPWARSLGMSAAVGWRWPTGARRQLGLLRGLCRIRGELCVPRDARRHGKDQRRQQHHHIRIATSCLACMAPSPGDARVAAPYALETRQKLKWLLRSNRRVARGHHHLF